MADLDVDEFIDELEAEMQTDPLEETKEEIAPPLVTQEPERTVEVEQEKEERYEEEQEEAVLAVVPELGEEEPPLEKIEIEEEEVKKKKRPLMWLPLIASLVILLAVVFLWRSFEEMAYRNEVEGELSTNIPKDRLNQSPETNMSMVLPTDSNAGLDSGNIREGNSGVTNESEIASNIQNEADVEAKTEEINSEEDGNTGIVEGEEISEDPVNEESTRVYGVKPQVQENNQCVIIVGAFKRMTNAHRMNDNLQKAGYQVYIDSSRNLTRVGFYSDCARSELRNRLDQARSEIESGAWILD